MRRVVTATSANGRSGVLYDGAAGTIVEPLPGLVIGDLWETSPARAAIGPGEDPADRPVSMVPPAGGTILKHVTYPPAASFDESVWSTIYADAGAGGGAPSPMHRTPTVDYIVILEGEIHCLLDDGEVHLRQGDILIQQGTLHHWENRSDSNCTMVGVMIDARPAQAGPAVPPDIDAAAARQEIVELIERYFHAIDHNDVEALRACLAEEATVEIMLARGARTFRRDEMAEAFQLRDNVARSHHARCNSLVEIGPDAATASTFATAHLTTQGAAGAGRIVVRGLHYDDVLHRKEGRWRIARRKHAVLWQYELPLIEQRLP